MQLRTKLTSPLILLLLISGLFLHIYLLPKIHQELEAEFNSTELAVIEAIGAASVQLLLTSDLAELYVLLDKQHQLHPHWITLNLINAKGTPIYPLDAKTNLSDHYGHTLRHEIYFGEQLIGILQVLADSSNAVHNKERAIALSGNSLLILFALLIIATSYFQHRMVSRPIHQLAIAANNMQHGDFDTALTISSKDEVGALAESFKNMRDSISLYQSALKSESQRNQAVLDNIFDAVITSDTRGNILSFNPAAERIFGYQSKEVLGRNLKFLMCEQDASHHDQHIQQYENTGEAHIIGVGREATGKRKDGSEFPIELAINETLIDNKLVFTGILRDVSARKNVENELAKQHQQIATVSQAQATFIATGDPVIFFQGLLPDILDLTSSEYGIIGEALHDENKQPYLKSYAASNFGWDEASRKLYDEKANGSMEFHDLDNLFGRVILDGKTIISNDPKIDSRAKGVPPGHPAIHAFLGVPFYMGERLVGMLGLANRPSGYDEEMVSLLQPIINTCAHLMDATAKERDRKRTAKELVKAKEAAESAAKAKSQFLATMSHEIRTPMNGVLGMLHLLEKTSLETKQLRYLETAMGSGEMLLTVINDILDFSKMEAGKLELESIPFDPISVVEETAALLAKSAQEKGLELISSIGSAVPHLVKGDPTRLRQILSNLINNAIKFTEDGHVAVYVDSDSNRIWFGVVDTGIGITEKQQQRLFQSFSQVDSSHTRKYGGTGLGLVISKRLINAMEGELRVSSVPGVGSDFRFELELKIIDNSPIIRQSTHLLKDQNILIVDDNTTNRLVLFNTLQNWGLNQIDQAENGVIALEKLLSASKSNQSFNIALLDMQMPGMDGLELGKRIRENDTLKDIKLLMLSSVDRYKTESEFDAWINKPVRQSDLYNSLIVLLDQQYNEHTPKYTQSVQKSYWFGGKKLLLVEDNRINQEVAEEILSLAGFSVDICNNGEKALHAVQNINYDIVLMDIQMPVMDGLTATREIRKLGGKHLKLPIIAMTAHALAGDSEKSLQAGMNAHVTKPIDPDVVFKVIGHWIDTVEPLTTTATTMPNKQIIDPNNAPRLPGINVKDGLRRLNGNWSSLQKFLRNFYNSQENATQIIGDHIAKKEWQEATGLAHTLKGNSGNIGAEQVHKDASNLEQACRVEDVTNAQQQLNLLHKSLALVISSIKTLQIEPEQQEQDTNTSSILDPEELKISVTKLKELLDSDLVEARTSFNTIKKQVTGSHWNNSLEEIQQALDNFDIDSAKASTDEFLKQCDAKKNIYKKAANGK